MVGCIAISLVELARLFAPGWSAVYMVSACVLAAVEGLYSDRLARARLYFEIDVWKFRATELATFFVLLKIGSYLGEGWESLLADVRAWPQDPLSFFDAETMTAFFFALAAWMASIRTTRDLERLAEPSDLDRPGISPLETLSARFFWGGMLLLTFSGLARVGIALLLDLRRPPVPGLVLNALVYFVLGLVMLGQVRFVTLRKEWVKQKIAMDNRLPGRWVRYSLAFIGLAALLAFVLPTGYTVGLLDTLAWILQWVLQILTYVATVLWFLCSLPLGLLASLFGRTEIPSAPPSSAPLEAMPPPPPPGAPGWLELLRSLLFWVLGLAALSYVIWNYVRDHPELLEALRLSRLIGRLRAFWRALWRRVRGWRTALGQRLARRVQREREDEVGAAPDAVPMHWARTSRGRVLRYYLSAVRLASRAGYPRRPPQTPYEYDDDLEPRLPEGGEEMGLLTDAFVEARYSQHAIEPQLARRARAYFRRVRAALRALRE
jgi:hypothetical protein